MTALEPSERKLVSHYEEELREAPKDWRAYLKESLEIIRVFGWVFRELVTPEAQKQAKIGVGYRLLAMLVMAVGPIWYGMALDEVVDRNMRGAIIFVGAYVLVSTVSRLFHNLSYRKTERVWGLCITSIEERTTRLFLSKSLGQHLREDSKLSVANIEKGLGQSMAGVMTLMNQAVPALAELLVGFIFLFWFSPVAGACLGIAFMGYVVFHVWMNRRIIEACTPIDNEWRKANRFRYERLDNPERVKTSGKEASDCDRLYEMLDGTRVKDFAFWRRYLVYVFRRGIFGDLMWGFAIAYGFYLAGSGTWKVGTAAALVYWANMVRTNLWQIGNVELNLNKAVYRVSPMMNALETPPDVVDVEGAIALEDKPVSVSVEGLTYRYPNKDEEGVPVIENLDFTIEPGERVALIGESGAGKTTVMRLLMRYTDPTEGIICINGIPLPEIKLRSWQRLFAYVPQQAQIFSGTLGENIRYAMTSERNQAVVNEDLEALMRELRLEGERFRDGLETVVGRRGLKLSGGEAQRVMVLSAIARRPRFLIVDEATSSLDSTTEKQVQAAIERAIEASSSAFIIAHRLSTVRRCSKFIVLRPNADLEDGTSQIEAVGSSFEELYRISPTFRRLADDQGVSCGSPPVTKHDIVAATAHWWNV